MLRVCLEGPALHDRQREAGGAKPVHGALVLFLAVFCFHALPFRPLAGAGNRMPIPSAEQQAILEKGLLRLAADAADQQAVVIEAIVFSNCGFRNFKEIKAVYRLSSP